jgi:hypothetical protein
MRVAAFLTDRAVVEQSIHHLGLTFAALTQNVRLV